MHALNRVCVCALCSLQHEELDDVVVLGEAGTNYT